MKLVSENLGALRYPCSVVKRQIRLGNFIDSPEFRQVKRSNCLICHSVVNIEKFLYQLSRITLYFSHHYRSKCCTFNMGKLCSFCTHNIDFCREQTDIFQLSRDVRKPDFCICENKDADQLRSITAKLISDFVFAIRTVQSLYYLNPKFQTSSHLL